MSGWNLDSGEEEEDEKVRHVRNTNETSGLPWIGLYCPALQVLRMSWCVALTDQSIRDIAR